MVHSPLLAQRMYAPSPPHPPSAGAAPWSRPTTRSPGELNGSARSAPGPSAAKPFGTAAGNLLAGYRQTRAPLVLPEPAICTVACAVKIRRRGCADREAGQRHTELARARFPLSARETYRGGGRRARRRT